MKAISISIAIADASTIFQIMAVLSLKELGQLAGGIHHNAVGIAIQVVHEHKPSRVRFGDIGLKINRRDKVVLLQICAMSTSTKVGPSSGDRPILEVRQN